VHSKGYMKQRSKNRLSRRLFNQALSAGACVVAGCAFRAGGQGLVQFRTYVPSTIPSIDAPIYLDVIGGTKLDSASAPGYRTALLAGPTTAQPAVIDYWNNPLTAGNLQMTYYPGNTALTWVGFRSGTGLNGAGYVNTGSSAARVVPVDAGQQVFVQMAVWTGDADTWIGAYAEAQQGLARVWASSPLTLTASGATGEPAYLWGLQSYALHVPEPGWPGFVTLGALLLGWRFLPRKR
jgi:hypothetical protein